jgi:hypothetical protein
MSLRQEVADLKTQIALLRELYVKRDNFHDATHIYFPRIVNNVIVGSDSITIVAAVKMIMDHLNLKIEKTPEKVELVQAMNNAPHINVGKKEEK